MISHLRALRRAVAAGAAAVIVALAVTACSGLPMNGPVSPGLLAGEAPEAPDFSFRPNGPQPGATPEQIVRGFVEAATSPAGNWAIAQQFLTPEFASVWRPQTGVTIDKPGAREYDEDGSTVTLRSTTTAAVDELGAYHVAEEAEFPLVYEVAQQSDGEWRITSAPDGIVLEADFFDDVFRAYNVMYFDPTWTFLVPDVRWFPYRTAVAARIAQALVDGMPSPWLEGAVVSAFPEEVALDVTSVPAPAGGVAQVELTDAALQAEPTVLGRMKRQLQESLRTAGINDVDLLVGGTVLEVEAAPVQQTTIDPRPLVGASGTFGFLTAEGVQPLTNQIGQTLAARDARSIALGRGANAAAALLGEGTAARVSADGAVEVVDERSGLIDPKIDPSGFVWSVPRDQPSALQAAIRGTGAAVIGAWPDATAIRAFDISRDGTRIAAILHTGGKDIVVAAGIIRGEDGEPVAVGSALRLAEVHGTGIDVGWLSNDQVGVLSRSTTTWFTYQLVGGPGAAVESPGGEVIALAAAGTAAGARVLGADGVLYTRRGSMWTRAAEGIDVLGSQLGIG